MLALALALVASPAFAEVGSNVDVRLDGPVKADFRMDARLDSRASIGEKREEAREMKGKIMDMKEDRMSTMKENKAEMDAKFDARKAELEALKVKLDAATTAEEKAAIKAEFEATRADFKADVKTERKENRSEVRAQTSQIKALRVQAVTTVYGAMIERMEKLSARIDSRIEKLSTEGKNVAEAKASLSIAASEIVLAKADHAKLSLSTSVEKADKEIMTSMKAHLKLAHEALMKAVSSLKIDSSASLN